MRRPVAALLTVAALGGSVLLASNVVRADRAIPGGTATPGVSYASTDQIVVKMQVGRTPDVAALRRESGRSVALVRNLSADTIVLKLPGAQSDVALRATVAAFARAPGVEWAEPDVRMAAGVDRTGEQWDLGPAGPTTFGVDLAGAWNALPPSPASVTVAVVDTGYVEHADLAGQIVPGYDFVSDSRIANDGGGRDSDARDPGDWITSRESRRGFFRGCPVGNSSWHGTHVSGTIGALVDADGIDGINPDARVLPVRVLGKCGGYTSDITDGVRWAAGLPVTGAPANPNVAKVVNLSLGGGGACSSTWQSAIDAVTAAGTTVVVSAGNSAADASVYSPASCDGVVTVASTGQAGDRAYYSNFGPTVEIAAPGGDRNADGGDTILSTLNAGTTSPIASPGGDTYVKYQGTSMAAPHVAGVASLMLAADPSLTPDEVAQIMRQTATPFPGGSTCAGVCGSGILNAASAVSAVAGTTATTTTTPPTTTTTTPPPPTTTTPPPPTTTTTLPTTTTTTTPVTAPGEFSKASPADGATRLNRNNVRLSWQSSSAATEYWVCIDTVVDGTCQSFGYGPYTGTSLGLRMARNTSYEWDVRAANTAGSTVSTGEPWSFSTR